MKNKDLSIYSNMFSYNKSSLESLINKFKLDGLKLRSNKTIQDLFDEIGYENGFKLLFSFFPNTKFIYNFENNQMIKIITDSLIAYKG